MRTPLHDQHLAAGGRIVEFAGWEMPVQYTGILHEHKAVRESCGVFDISHMGEFFVEGPGATAWLDSLLTNNLAGLSVGHAQYTLLLNERGGVIDDLLAYRLAEEKYLLIVNAAKIDEDAAWLRKHAASGVTFTDRSSEFAALAIQGPTAAEVFEKLFQRPMPAERNRVLEIHPGSFIATTGYTGEAGFEWVMPASEATAAWQAALAAGATPCGLGARDTLRLEMCYPLNGSDLSPDRTPLEAGLVFFCDLKKPAFLGRDALLAQKQLSVLPHKLCALRVTDKSPPIRSHYRVFVNGEPVTETTSGALSPSLGYGIALAYLPPAYCDLGQEVQIEVRDRRFRAEVVKKPFLKKP
ncbi:MAG: glycine cleavage system protein T [Spartobacteria bacterium AMD-G5]|nr:MAG: glycine cleavage system protein T [Spartobacteria bacterium AMD-G5]